MEGEGAGVGHRVGGVDPLDGDAAELNRVAGGDRGQPGAGEQTVLAQLVAQDAEGEGRPEDGDVEAGQDVREGADVVLVTVGEDDAAHLLAPLHQPAHVGDDQVDPEHLGLGEHQAGVDHHDVVTAFDREEVAADLAEAPQGDQAEARDPGPGGCADAG